MSLRGEQQTRGRQRGWSEMAEAGQGGITTGTRRWDAEGDGDLRTSGRWRLWAFTRAQRLKGVQGTFPEAVL